MLQEPKDQVVHKVHKELKGLRVPKVPKVFLVTK